MESASPSPNARKLDSWKEIAAHLGRGVSTVRRWEREQGLPIHRLSHNSAGTVFAYTDELDAWLNARSAMPSGVPVPLSTAATTIPAAPLIVAIIATFSLGAWGVFRFGPSPEPTSIQIPLAVARGMDLEPALSSDGGKLAYVSDGMDGGNPWRLIIRNTAGTSVRELSPFNDRPQFPQWSHDGQRLLYSRIAGPDVRIYVAGPEGENPSLIAHLTDAAYARQRSIRWAVWGPRDESLIVIKKPSGSAPYALFRLSLDGRSSWSQLTFPSPGDRGEQQAAVSPDGRWIAFARYKTGVEGALFVVPAVGGTPRQLTSNASFVSGIAWAADSIGIVFSARRLGPSWDLWRTSIQGDEPVRIPGTSGDASWPSVSGTGASARIAYQRGQETVNLRLLSPGNAKTSFACPSTLFDADAQFSPDARQIAFASTRSGSRQVWTCSLSTGEATQVTSFPSGTVESPRWSPDGKELVVSASVSGNFDIYVVNLDSHTTRRITSHPADERRPSWSADGAAICFGSDSNGLPEIWKVSSRGTNARQITHHGGFEAFENLSGDRLYFAKPRPAMGIWSTGPEGGGADRLELENVRESLWGLSRVGIHFIRLNPFGEIGLKRFDSPREVTIAHAPSDYRGIWAGFSVTPDGATVVWPQTVESSSDIFLLSLAAHP